MQDAWMTVMSKMMMWLSILALLLFTFQTKIIQLHITPGKMNSWKNRQFQKDDQHACDGYCEQDYGHDLMSLLEIYFLHVAGYLSGAFNVFLPNCRVSCNCRNKRTCCGRIQNVHHAYPYSFCSALLLLPTVLCFYCKFNS